MVSLVFSAFRGVCDMSLTRVPAQAPCDFVMAAMRFKKTSRRCYQSSRARDGTRCRTCLCSCGIADLTTGTVALESGWSSCSPDWAGSCAESGANLPKIEAKARPSERGARKEAYPLRAKEQRIPNGPRRGTSRPKPGPQENRSEPLRSRDPKGHARPRQRR